MRNSVMLQVMCAVLKNQIADRHYDTGYVAFTVNTDVDRL